MPTQKTYRKRGGYVADGLKDLGGKGGAALGKLIGGVIEKMTGVGAYRKRYSGKGAYRRRGAYTGRTTGFRYANRGAYTRRGAYGRRRLTGRGSYNEEANGMLAPLPPTFSGSRNANWVEICHREYIGDVYSSSNAGALAISSFYINPSDTLCFPWLSQLAAIAFQQYELCGCIFEFKSMSSDALNSTNTALGTIVAAVVYDATDAIPTTRAEMENTDWSQAYKPSQSFLIPVECDRKETFGRGLLYTRASSLIPTGQDRRLYDMGRIDIASLGMQGTSVNLGSLYVTYKVRLYKQWLAPPLILQGCYHTFNSTSIAASTPLGVAANDTIVRNSLGIVHTSATVLTLPLANCIPNAVYRVDILWTGTTASITAPSFTAAGALATINGFGTTANMNASTDAVPPNSASSSNFVLSAYLQVSATPTANGTITIGTGGTIPTSGNVDIQINQVSATFNQNN